jgi:hypothetical protein
MIDYKNESHLALAPYSHIENKCAFYVGEEIESDREAFLERIKRLNNGSQKN